MFEYIICQSFKKIHRAVFSIAHHKYSNFGVYLTPDGNASFWKLLIDIHIYFWLKGNILALIHLGVLLLNNYEITSIYEYHVWRYSCAKQFKLGKRGVALKYRPGIKNMIKKITKILSINYHHKMLQQGIYI